MSSRVLRSGQRVFWLLVRDGLSFREAAVRLGLDAVTGTKLVSSDWRGETWLCYHDPLRPLPEH